MVIQKHIAKKHSYTCPRMSNISKGVSISRRSQPKRNVQKKKRVETGKGKIKTPVTEESSSKHDSNSERYNLSTLEEGNTVLIHEPLTPLGDSQKKKKRAEQSSNLPQTLNPW